MEKENISEADFLLVCASEPRHVPGKLFEYLLHDQISFFLEDNMILNDCQFGFRRYHNTTHATLNFVNNILQSFNSNNNFLALFIDFRKAFDMINHNILLE